MCCCGRAWRAAGALGALTYLHIGAAALWGAVAVVLAGGLWAESALAVGLAPV